jgi:hypothetical protein
MRRRCVPASDELGPRPRVLLLDESGSRAAADWRARAHLLLVHRGHLGEPRPRRCICLEAIALRHDPARCHDDSRRCTTAEGTTRAACQRLPVSMGGVPWTCGRARHPRYGSPRAGRRNGLNWLPARCINETESERSVCASQSRVARPHQRKWGGTSCDAPSRVLPWRSAP